MQGAHRGIGFFALLATCSTQPGTEPEPCTWTAFQVVGSSATGDAVDLLFVVDNSASMLELQRSLVEVLPEWLDRLRTGDSNDDGVADLPAIEDVHVGVVSGDLGTYGFWAAGCADPVDGDGGILISSPRVGGAECEDDYPRYLSYAEGDDPQALPQDFECLAVLGTNGCSFQQPLEVARTALVDEAYEANGDFLRQDTLLAIVFATDADDCSAGGGEGGDLFNGALFSSPADVRCALEGEPYLVPPATIATDLLGLREVNPSRLVVAVLAGTPFGASSLDQDDPAAPFDELLADPRMTPQADDGAQHLVPSCEARDGGSAVPPRRLVTMLREAAAGGATAVAASVCDPDPAAALAPVVEAIQRQLYGVCIGRPLPVRPEGGVDCILEEELLDDGPCPPGRVDLGTTDRGRLCHVCQQGDGSVRTSDVLGNDVRGCADAQASGDFWEYGHWQNCTRTGRIEFRGDSMPRPGSVVSLECFERDC